MATDVFETTKICILLCLLISQVMCRTRGRRSCVELRATSTLAYLNLPNNTGRYERNSYQCWRIWAGRRSHKVKISFLSFMLEYHVLCSHDNLTVFDGKDSNASEIGRYCGTTVPDDIVSNKDVIYLEFRSDYSEEFGGFKFSYYSGEEDALKTSNDDNHKLSPTLTTVIVGGMMGVLVLIIGIVVTVCVCFSSRRCLCRQGSRTVNSNSSTERGGNQTTHTRRHFVRRTDRVSHGDSPPSSSLPPVEGPATDFPFQVILPRYTEPSAPPPYNRHEVIELQRLPSSPPPPYSSNDPNPLFVSLGDIDVPSIPGEATHSF